MATHFQLILLLVFAAIIKGSPVIKDPMMEKYFEGNMRFGNGFNIFNGITDDRYLWPENTAPYMISSAFTTDERDVILGALTEISNKTCIRFVERSSEADYVFIQRGEPYSGCGTYGGRLGGRQEFNLEPGPGSYCIFHGGVVHLMIHAMGFDHDQSRTDRDDYVTILWDNVISEAEHNFGKYSSSQPTIVPKQNAEIGQMNGLSESDAQKIWNMYNC